MGIHSASCGYFEGNRCSCGTSAFESRMAREDAEWRKGFRKRQARQKLANKRRAATIAAKAAARAAMEEA